LQQEASAATGQFLSLRGGQISYAGSVLPDKALPLVILDVLLENVFYEDKYDPDSPQAPACYAFGRDETTMAPHEKASKKQHPTCKGCPQNEWGTSDVGRGKACRNTRRLAVIPAGAFDAQGRFDAKTAPEHFDTAMLAYMKLPVTSVKGFATFVKQVAVTMQRPPFGVFTKLSVVPDKKDQFHATFEVLGAIPNAVMPNVMKRHEDAMALIDFPYPEMEERTEKPKKAKARRF